MRRPARHFGYIENGPGLEADILSCNHCQMQMEVRPPKGAVTHSMDLCGHCDRPICPHCAVMLSLPDGKCVPFVDRITAWEARAALRKAAGI